MSTSSSLLVLLVALVVCAATIEALGTANPPPLPKGGKRTQRYQHNYGPQWFAEAKEAWEACVALCEKSKDSFSAATWGRGPCLSHELRAQWRIDNWECDVQNWPSQPEIDNEDPNLCPNYLSGDSRHMAVVMPDCKLLRAF